VENDTKYFKIIFTFVLLVISVLLGRTKLVAH